MEKQNKQQTKLTTKKLTKIFSIIWFVLVFIFTFCIASKEIRENPTNLMITASVVFGTLGVSIIVWLVWYLILKKKGRTENDKTIAEAIKRQEKEEDKERNK